MQPSTVAQRLCIYMEIIFCIVKGVPIASVDTMRKFGFCRRPQERGEASSTRTVTVWAAQGTSRYQRIRESRRLRYNHLPSTLSGSNSRWIREPVDYTEECMGRKDKNIPNSPSRLCHSCEAVSYANFYPWKLASRCASWNEDRCG